MPQQIEVDGVVGEYYTPDELQELSTKAAEEKVQQTLEEKQKEWEQEKAILEESINPNWKEARSKMSIMEKKLQALESQGKTLDDNGQVVDLNRSLTQEDIDKRATEIVNQQFLQSRINDRLRGLDDQTKEVVKTYYNKLTTGEEVTLDNVDKYLTDAARMASPDPLNPIMSKMGQSSSAGFNQTYKPEQGGYAESQEGKELAELMGLPINK